MNPFTLHTQQQGVTYLQHLFFASGIAWRLSSTVIAFAVHAIFPFIDIDKTLDLEATVDYLQERNDWVEDITLNDGLRPIEPTAGSRHLVLQYLQEPPQT